MSGERRKLFFFAALFLVLGAIYAPALGYGLNLDDREQLDYVGFHGAERLLGSDYHLRPVKNLLFTSGETVFGDSYLLWRITALGIFFLLVVVAEAYLELMLGSRPVAMAACAAWALLAVHSSVIVWLSAYHIMIYAVSMICALLWADRASTNDSVPLYVLSTAALVVSLVSYEAAIAFPPLLALQAWILRRSYRTRAGRAYLAAVAGAVSVYVMTRLAFGARLTVQPDNLAYPDGQPWWLTLNAARYVLLHAYYAANPWTTFGVRLPDLPADHAVVAAVAWIVFLSLSMVAVFHVVRRRSLVGFGWLFFVVGVAPTCNFIPVASGPVADYYLLVASLGLILAAAAVVTALARTVESAPSMLGRGLLYAAVGAWIGANVFSTVLERVPAWNNPLTLTEHARKIQGESFFHDFLAARMRAGVGEYAEAVRLYAMALDAAPYHEPSQVGRVVALINARDLTAAEHAMAGLSPRAAEPRERLRVSRAFVLEARGNHDQAAELYRAIINDPTPAGVEAKITALVRLTHMSQRFGMAMDVRYSLERAPFDVQRFYLFPGYHRRS